ncbi:MAG: M61 family peptidase [Bacteroidia bacterium]
MSHLHYSFGWEKANTQLIHILFKIGNVKEEILEVNLPSWRPGRYEITNFAKNIIHIGAVNEKGEILSVIKTSKDSWNIECKGASTIKIKYTYHAAILNAGSSWLDENQLYINPVNCCLYLPSRISEECEIELKIPDNYKIAIDKKTLNCKNNFIFKSFDELADTPFIASANLKHIQFEEKEHVFHLWFQGVNDIPEDRLIKDFRAFCSEQLSTMGDLPGNEYHFMFQILPEKFYHGVEHTYSTVCALGPAADVFNVPLYDEFLGVSSHELFHAWNVKTIRPVEMLPYQFNKENYSSLGWVYEGITTWYGDAFLFRSGVFNFEQFSKTLDEKLKRHFTNYGRFNLSVAESSFDTWLDGYVAGAPHRKTSIYTEGSLISFILDGRIRQFSDDKASLDDLMRKLYVDAKKGKSYSRARLIELLDELAHLDHETFFSTYIEGCTDLEPLLRKYLQRIGLDLIKTTVFSDFEHKLGLRLNPLVADAEVLLVAPDSPAELAGLMSGDKLIALDGFQFNQVFRSDKYFEGSIGLHAFSQGKLKEFRIKAETADWFMSRKIAILENASLEQRQAFKSWSGQDYPG